MQEKTIRDLLSQAQSKYIQDVLAYTQQHGLEMMAAIGNSLIQQLPKNDDANDAGKQG